MMAAVITAANVAHQAAQAAQASVQANGVGPGAGTTTLLRDEGRSVDKPERFCPKNFDEEQNRWDEWKHTFKNYVCMQDQGFVNEMHSIGQNRQEQHALDAMVEETSRRCRHLYAMLSSFIRGRLLKIIRIHEKERSGYAAWRDILQELEPRERGRGLALLFGLVSGESWPTDLPEFLDQVRAREQTVAHYEDATGKLVPDDLRVAVVPRHAPGDIGRQLRIQASHDMSRFA